MIPRVPTGAAVGPTPRVSGAGVDVHEQLVQRRRKTAACDLQRGLLADARKAVDGETLDARSRGKLRQRLDALHTREPEPVPLASGDTRHE